MPRLRHSLRTTRQMGSLTVSQMLATLMRSGCTLLAPPMALTSGMPRSWASSARASFTAMESTASQR